LIRWVWGNRDSLIGFGVDYPSDKFQHICQESRQESLHRSNQENLIEISVQITDDRAPVQQADCLQSAESQIRPDDDTGLWRGQA
jgi:hypothetical protein